jgi:hypothetical protein
VTAARGRAEAPPAEAVVRARLAASGRAGARRRPGVGAVAGKVGRRRAVARDLEPVTHDGRRGRVAPSPAWAPGNVAGSQADRRPAQRTAAAAHGGQQAARAGQRQRGQGGKRRRGPAGDARRGLGGARSPDLASRVAWPGGALAGSSRTTSTAADRGAGLAVLGPPVPKARPAGSTRGPARSTTAAGARRQGAGPAVLLGLNQPTSGNWRRSAGRRRGP